MPLNSGIVTSMTTISGCSVGSGFANHLHVRLGRQNHAEAIADHDVVIR